MLGALLFRIWMSDKHNSVINILLCHIINFLSFSPPFPARYTSFNAFLLSPQLSRTLLFLYYYCLLYFVFPDFPYFSPLPTQKCNQCFCREELMFSQYLSQCLSSYFIILYLRIFFRLRKQKVVLDMGGFGLYCVINCLYLFWNLLWFYIN